LRFDKPVLIESKDSAELSKLSVYECKNLFLIEFFSILVQKTTRMNGVNLSPSILFMIRLSKYLYPEAGRLIFFVGL